MPPESKFALIVLGIVCLTYVLCKWADAWRYKGIADVEIETESEPEDTDENK